MCAVKRNLDGLLAPAFAESEMLVQHIADPENEMYRHPAPYEISYQIINTLPHSVWCVNQMGVIAEIPRARDPAKLSAGIHVLVVYTSNVDVKVNIDGLLNGVEHSEQSLEAYRRAFSEFRTTNGTSGRSRSAVRYSISRENFESRNSVGFMSQVGLIFCEKDPGLYWHPFSQECISTNYMAELQGSVSYQLRANDPKHRYTALYTNINGFVYEVIPIRDPAIPEGIYVYKQGQIDSGSQKVEIRLITFEEAFKTTPLFATALEAESYGDPAARAEADYQFQRDTLQLQRVELEREDQKRRDERSRMEHVQSVEKLNHERASMGERVTMEQFRAELERERELMKMTLEKMREEEKLRITKEKNEVDEAKARLAYEQAKREHELKLEQMQRTQEALERKIAQEAYQSEMRDHYERRSYDRKDSSEFFKWLPAVALGAAAFMIKGS